MALQIKTAKTLLYLHNPTQPPKKKHCAKAASIYFDTMLSDQFRYIYIAKTRTDQWGITILGISEPL